MAVVLKKTSVDISNDCMTGRWLYPTVLIMAMTAIYFDEVVLWAIIAQ
jgi:hypothetical protein